MKKIITKLFIKKRIVSSGEILNNLKDLRSTRHVNGVRVYDDLVADVLAAKIERLNLYEGSGNGNYMPRTLSIARTVYP